MIKIIFILFINFLLSDQLNPRLVEERLFVNNGRIDASISEFDENLILVQINAINDSLLSLANEAISNLELYAGPASYHRIINSNQFNSISEYITSDYLLVLDENYVLPNQRNYWVHTIHGNNYYGSSGEISSTCMCLDASDCVVVGYNDSWYNPLDYYGEAWWNFIPPNFDEVVEARVYVQGGQCDNLPIWSETDVSMRDNNCSWNSDFQATLSIDYTLNGPYVIPDNLLENIWCEGNLQPIIGSEDNYSVDFVRIELLYSCSLPEPISNFNASNQEFCNYVELNWELNDSNESYNLYRDDQLVTTFNNDVSQFLDYQASSNSAHQYCLNSENECGISENICAMGMRKSNPGMVNSINASDGTNQNYIFISWDSDNDDILYYNLYRDGSQLSVIPSNQELNYIDEFVEQQNMYNYCIEAVNDCGESEWNCDIGFLGIGIIGDINLDDTIDVLDVVLLLNFILEINTPTNDQEWLSDVNSDNMINILDIVALVNIILS